MSKMDFSHTAAFIWSVADLLRGDFKQSQYGRIILPFALLRRLECVLENSKDAVVTQAHTVNAMDLPEEAREKLILRATGGLTFFNTSPMNLSNLGQKDIRDNLENYIQSFSTDAREIFEHFKFSEFISQLDEANLLFKVVQKVASTDLSPAAVSNHDMGLVFEELIRRFAEGSNVQEDDVDLQNVVMSHYRLSKMREQQLRLTAASAEEGLQPGNDVGSAKPKDKKEDFMSQILERLNALFVGDHLTDKDMINCAFTVKDKISENTAVMTQLANNTREQAMLGDFPKAVDEAIMDCNAAQQNMMMQYLSNPALAKGFAQVVFDMLKAG